MDEEMLEQRIEELREQMVQMAEFRGNLLDAHVLAISQQLDKMLVQLQRIRLKRRLAYVV